MAFVVSVLAILAVVVLLHAAALAHVLQRVHALEKIVNGRVPTMLPQPVMPGGEVGRAPTVLPERLAAVAGTGDGRWYFFFVSPECRSCRAVLDGLDVLSREQRDRTVVVMKASDADAVVLPSGVRLVLDAEEVFVELQITGTPVLMATEDGQIRSVQPVSEAVLPALATVPV